MTRLLVPLALAALLFPTPAVAYDPVADECALRNAGVGTDGPALMQFFRSRTAGAADRDRITALIKQLGDDSFDQRERASAELLAIGPRAEPPLRDAVKHDPDPEVKRRAEDCLRQLAREGDLALPAAAARVLAARKPDGAVAVLLAYLPDAPGEIIADEVRAALATVAVKDGKADPVLLQALEDKLPVKRSAAAVALCQAGARDHFPAVRTLLHDRESSVRLRVALALAHAREKEAVPALIELLGDLPPSQAYEAEDVLRALAGEAAPDATPGKSQEERTKCRDAWAAWWKKNGDKVDLAKLAEGVSLGRTLIVDRGLTPPGGRVLEVGRDGKVVWEIDGLNLPTDAQVLPGGRVLICEYSSRRLTERTTRGEIVWEKVLPVAGAASYLLGAQRLANGHTFVATRTSLMELDRDGKEVWTYKHTGGAIYAARKSRTGEVAFITLEGTCVRLDANGKEVGSFPAGRVQIQGGIDLLPNGNVLVPLYSQNQVIEYDATGKAVWQVTVARPSSAVRLPNGHTLVSNAINQRVVELDRDGKEVWKVESVGRPYKAYRR
jgi:outer membrane protein assembly factor BamB